MMFNTYGIESGRETEESQQRQSKRNRGDVPDKHKLMTAPPHAKRYRYKEKHIYKWNLTASQPYQQQVIVIGTTGFVNIVM